MSRKVRTSTTIKRSNKLYKGTRPQLLGVKVSHLEQSKRGGRNMELTIKATPTLSGEDAKSLIKDLMREPSEKVIARNKSFAKMVKDLRYNKVK